MAGTQPGRRGVLLVISSPSGAGKSTLARSLIETDKAIQLSVSVTTRDRRPSEADGVHYHFVDRRKFDAMRKAGDLLEWAEVHGNFYGSPREPIERALSAGDDVLFDIDWQGTQQLYARMRADIVGVFILPPSATELKHRLERRAEDSDEIIQRRLRNARTEIEHWKEYDYVLINEDLNSTFEQLRYILSAERARRTRQNDLAAHVASLDQDLAKMVSALPGRPA
jgi:guanylate kinase